MKQKGNELQIIRTYDAPVKLVWDAWTDLKHVAKWWGPRGFTITTKSKDFKVGGQWIYTMHGPDGTDYPNITTYHEIVEHQKLVYDHGGDETRQKLFTVTALFKEVKGKTTLSMTFKVDTEEAATQMKQFIKQAGGNSTWDRLGEYLEKEISGKDKFVINRTFNTSIETMFEMWTNPKHFSKWLAPTGFNMEFKRADIQPGHSSFYVMSGNGMKMYGRVEYLKIQKPDLIVYTQQFVDENEKISRHPMAPTWPETMLTTVQLTSEGPDYTRVTVSWEPYGKTSKEELETFIKMRAGMTQGWTGSFDKLEDYLKA